MWQTARAAPPALEGRETAPQDLANAISFDLASLPSPHSVYLTGGAQPEHTICAIARPDTQNRHFHLTQTVEGIHFSLRYEFSERGLPEPRYSLRGLLEAIDDRHHAGRIKLMSFDVSALCDEAPSVLALNSLTQGVHEAFIDGGAPALYRLLRQAADIYPGSIAVRAHPATFEVMELEIEQEANGDFGIQPRFMLVDEPPDIETEVLLPAKVSYAGEALALIEAVCVEEFAALALCQDPDLAAVQLYFPEDFADATTPSITSRKLPLRPILESVLRSRSDRARRSVQVRLYIEQRMRDEDEPEVRLSRLILQGPRRWVFFREQYQLIDPDQIWISPNGINDAFFRALFRALHQTNCDQLDCGELKSSAVYKEVTKELGYRLEPTGLLARLRAALWQ